MSNRSLAALCLVMVPALCSAQGGGAGGTGADTKSLEVTLRVASVWTSQYHYKQPEWATDDKITVIVAERDVYRVVKWDRNDPLVELEFVRGERTVSPGGGGTYTVAGTTEFDEKWTYLRGALAPPPKCGVNIDPDGRNCWLAVAGDFFGATDEIKAQPEHRNHAVAYGFSVMDYVGDRLVDGKLTPSPASQQLKFHFDPGQKNVTASGNGSHTWTRKGEDGAVAMGTVGVSFTVDIQPEPTVDAIIKPQGGYKTWLPAASTKPGHAGNRLGFKVELKDKKTGGKREDVTASFECKLLGTSNWPGSCMNSFWTDTEPDLQFVADDSPQLVQIAPDGQSGGTKENLTHCEVYVSCFDGAAYGRLQVIAHVSDGTNVRAKLEEDGSEEVAFPYAVDGNHIAYQWEKDNGVVGWDPKVDDEDKPEGDGMAGDGLTLWEEYRGFLAKGVHVRADPHKKKFFLCNTLGGLVEPGIDLFARLSGLKVIRMTEDELSPSRVVNRNANFEAHVVDQHGVIIRGWSSDVNRAEGGPGTPKSISQVLVDPTGNAAFLRHTVAHELLHCCNVSHHGERDKTVWWHAETVGGVTSIYEFDDEADVGVPAKGDQIKVYVCDNPAQVYIPTEAYWKTPHAIWLGRIYGQHSGVEDCVMRYTCSGAYIDRSLRRYWLKGIPEHIGQHLCNSPKGTGVNDPHHQPCSRYDDADEDRGNCQHHICVNDLYH